MANTSSDQIRELQEIVRCVQMFFGQQKTQRQIALALGIQQSKVSRLLKRARDEGFYSIEFEFPALVEIAARLIDRYQLRDAVVIPTGEAAYLKKDLGRAAARYFERVVHDGARVGLSCGNTLFHFVEQLRAGPRNIHIYPLAAETSLKFVDISFNTLVGVMTAKYRPTATGYALPAYLLNQSEASGRAIFEDRQVKKIFNDSLKVDIAIVGIGALDAANPGFCELAARAGILPKKLESLGVIGEFNHQPFDKKGSQAAAQPIATLMRHFIGMSLEELAAMSQQRGRLVVALAGGHQKKEAVRGALNGTLFNVLVTDMDTASYLLMA